MEAELTELGLEGVYTAAVDGETEAVKREAITKLSAAVLNLAAENELLRKKAPAKSEKLRRGQLEGQLELFPGALDELESEADGELDPQVAAELAEAEAAAEAEKQDKKQPRRPKLPASLPKDVQESTVPDDQRCCPECGERDLAHLGHDTSEQLEWVPGHFKRIEFRREKLSCPRCREVIITAPVPVKPIPKGIAGPGLLARIIVDKYIKHLPLYRQAAGYAIEHGVILPVATLCDWVMRVGLVLVAPIYEAMVAEILKSKVIHTDDTSVRVQARSASETGFARLWPYLGDSQHPHVVFDYTTSRNRDGPRSFLGEFEGYLQADAWSGYDCIYASGRVKEVACWAHARRYFLKAREKDPKRSRMVLLLIQRLYEVERRAGRVSPEARLALRQRESKPILKKLEQLTARFAGEVLPKGPMGQAITYVRNQWAALTRFTEDADLCIDNNAAERAIRPVAIGRKNWLHIGSDRAGKAAAILYSLLASCKLHEVDPVAYFTDILIRVHTHPADRMIELSPAGWKAATEASVASVAA